ncbi:hypothetical protein GCM10023325_20300 [Sphingomonas lutea]
MLILLVATVFLIIDARETSVTNFMRSALQQALNIGLPYFILSRGLSKSVFPARVLLSLILAACILAGIAGFESLRHWLLYAGMDVGADPEMLSGYTKQRAGALRGQATFPEPTTLSLFLGLALVMLFALRRSVGSVARALMFVVLAFGLVFTFARVGFLVSIVGLVACLIYERRWGLVALIAASAPPIWYSTRALGTAIPTIGEMIGLSGDAVITVEYRRRLSERMFALIREHPFFGVSRTDIQIMLDDLRQGEGIIDLVNGHFAVMLQAGVAGWLALMLAVAFALHSTWRDRRSQHDGSSAAVFSSMAALQAALFTTALIGRNLLWFVVLLAFAAGLSVRRRHEAKNAPAAMASSLPRPASA